MRRLFAKRNRLATATTISLPRLLVNQAIQGEFQLAERMPEVSFLFTLVTIARALHEIKYYQKHSDSLVVALAPFRRLVREIANKLPLKFNIVDRFTEESMILLQMAAEEHITNFMEMS